MLSKKGTVFPKKGTLVPEASGSRKRSVSYAAMVSSALRKDLGKTHRAAKTVMQWTGVSERTVKHWFAGTRGPSGEHLMTLIRHSDSVLTGFLLMAGREHRVSRDKLIEVRGKLNEVIRSFEELTSMDG